jgi:hypothetical protein
MRRILVTTRYSIYRGIAADGASKIGDDSPTGVTY